MASIVEIWNMAIGNLGQAVIIQSENEESLHADTCRIFWPSARRSVLSMYDWSFARKFLTLSLSADDVPTDRWEYMYDLPLDCLTVRYIDRGLNGSRSDPKKIPYEIIQLDSGTKVLLTDESECKICYTIDTENPNMYDPSFVEAAAQYLAALTCMPITKKSDMRDRLMGGARMAIDISASKNLNEQNDQQEVDSPGILSRL